MQINFKTRAAARQFNAKRLALGVASKVVDRGLQTASCKSVRYAVANAVITGKGLAK